MFFFDFAINFSILYNETIEFFIPIQKYWAEKLSDIDKSTMERFNPIGRETKPLITINLDLHSFCLFFAPSFRTRPNNRNFWKKNSMEKIPRFRCVFVDYRDECRDSKLYVLVL